MEQEKKKSELLSFIDKYKLVREDNLVFYIRTSMEEVQSTCQKCDERHRLITYVKRFLPLWIRVLQICLDASIVVGGILLLLHLTKRR